MGEGNVFEPQYESEVAIIGMSGRFPGARDIDAFWRNLRNAVESISFFSDQELETAGVPPAVLRHPDYVKAGAVLADVEMFDAAFFGLSPREAEVIDPQHRLFLECAWQALENAGYPPGKCRDRIGVYAGVGVNYYALFNLRSNRDLIESLGGFQTTIASDKDFLSTRLSYKLDLKGPSVTVQTACSTSLVATHLAWQSLLNGECDMALAGGVSIRIPQKMGYVYQEGLIHSPDGRCRAFDAQAQGTVGGSGMGIVVLKRLADALADGDHVRAVIKGSAINNDGSTKVGYTAPSVDGQAEVIVEALAMAGVEPETVTYIEAHGTGTPLGDPIEIAALTQAFRARTEKKGFCAIGSVKTNIGHVDAAAGVAGLIKTVLALEHKEIPPSLHFTEPNPNINFASSPFYVNTQLRDWKTDGQLRRAGVSSFGIGGTNAHVILEEAPPSPPTDPGRGECLLTLSAKTEAALGQTTANLAAYLRQHPELNLADVAYTLQVGRHPFAHRRVLACQNGADAAEALETVDPGRCLTAFEEPRQRPLVFLFPGQGAQHVNMGRGLYESEPLFRATVDRCVALLEPHLGFDLLEVLYPDPDGEAAATKQLNQTAIAQPALFVVEYALARLWQAWGLQPQAMIGHSIGEVVAACLAGVFTLEDALALLVHRGRLIQQLPGGSMLGVPLAEAEILSFLDNHHHHQLSLAAVNGPQRCTVSGTDEAVEALQAQLEGEGIGCQRLHTSHAFHSAMMDPILDDFAACVGRVPRRAPDVPFVSGVTGRWITADEATDRHYWARHLRQTVRFADGLQQALLTKADLVLLEVGPGRALTAFARQQQAQAVLPSLRHPRDRQPDRLFLLNTLGQLWLSGLEIDWRGFYGDERRRRVPLPTYPFARRRYWIELAGQANDIRSQQRPLDKKPDVTDWFYAPLWKQSVPPEPGHLADSASCWLVFLDACELGAQMVRHLEQTGQKVTVVTAGKGFCQTGDEAYALHPRRQDDYDALFEELAKSGKIPQRIVHLWSVTPTDPAQSEFDTFEEAQDSGFYSLLYLAQALGKRSVEHSLYIGVVSNDMQSVTGSEVLRPEKATLLGPCRVIPQEYSNVTCCSIDVVVPQSGTWPEELIERFVGELAAEPNDPVVAYRGGRRWVQTYEALRLNSMDGFPRRLRQGGVYLITGGLGGMGLVLAEHLAQTVQARLVLTGRSAFPAPDEWEQWLAAHDEQDGVSGRIKKLQALQELGAEVLVLSADVADQEQMQAVVSQVYERFGMIQGVIHAAGVAGGGIVQLKTSEMAARVLAPKVKGTLVLKEIFKETNLDFFVLCSSLSSILGGFGQSDYCAANAFLDVFAHRQPFTIAINWDTWQEVGMAVDTAVPLEIQRWREENLRRGILPLEGVDAFGRILGHGLNQILVSTLDFPTRFEHSRALTVSDVLEGLEQARLSRPKHPRPGLRNEYVAPRDEVEQTLADIWQDLLGIEQVGIHDNFYELGGDSLLFMQVVARAKRAGLRFVPQQLVEHQTIAELAAVENTVVVQAEQGLVTGPRPLTAMEARYFDLRLYDASYWNLAGLFQVYKTLDPGLMERAVQHILGHHDALRTRFVGEGSDWQASTAAPTSRLPFTCIDLSGLPAATQRAAIETAAGELQESFDLSEGAFLRVVFFDLGASRPDRLLIIVPHLVADAYSFQILLEDLYTAYRQLDRGERIQLLPKTTSVQQWAERLGAHVQSAEMRQELDDYWLILPWEEIPPLPVDYPPDRGNHTIASSRTVTASLTVEETRLLLHEVPQVYKTEITDALLMALVQALTNWTGGRWVQVMVANAGRSEGLFAGDVDLSRTVGYLSFFGCVTLERKETANPGEALLSIQEQLGRIPNKGLGYPLLRYCGRDQAARKLASLCKDEVYLNYGGQVDDRTNDEVGLFRPAQESIGARIHPRNHFATLDCRAFIEGNRLVASWKYGKNIHKRSTIERVMQDFVEALRSLIDSALDTDAHG